MLGLDMIKISGSLSILGHLLASIVALHRLCKALHASSTIGLGIGRDVHRIELET